MSDERNSNDETHREKKFRISECCTFYSAGVEKKADSTKVPRYGFLIGGKIILRYIHKKNSVIFM